MMTRALDILFIPIDGVGHVNAAIGIAQVLYSAGHRITFAINDQWKGRLAKYGFQEVLLPQADRQGDDDPAQYWSDVFVKVGAINAANPLNTMVNVAKNLYPMIIEQMNTFDPVIEKLLAQLQPDVIVLDQALEIPAVVNSGIPWVWTCSFNPLVISDDDRVPPPGLGLPSIGVEKDTNEWERCRETINNAMADNWQNYTDFVMSKGLPPLPANRFYSGSPHLNIYSYPLELDYLDMRPLPPKWHQFDNLKRYDSKNENDQFVIPAALQNKAGKLIYFSMGSMGGADVDNMNRLLAIMSRSTHRFIVSKGPKAQQIRLNDNMWGEGSVPQIQVLPLVDLVITHGGNNTITETFYFGKPMIVLPLFHDQYDNAQRVQDKGFGIRLDAYKCSEEELLNAIESLLNNKELNEKLLKISQRIQSDNSIAKLLQLIEKLVTKEDLNNNI